MFPSYKNQSIALKCKSVDWFLYEYNICFKWVKLVMILHIGKNTAKQLKKVNSKCYDS